MNILKFVIAVGITLLAGFIGSVFTAEGVSTWYPALVKPALTPPNWIFGPVWTLLYILIGAAAGLIWQYGIYRKTVINAGSIFVLQLFLNASWSVVFFYIQSPGWAFLNLLALWAVIVWMIAAFARLSRLAAWLLVPYLLWVSYAGYLNLAIWWLN